MTAQTKSIWGERVKVFGTGINVVLLTTVLSTFGYKLNSIDKKMDTIVDKVADVKDQSDRNKDAIGGLTINQITLIQHDRQTGQNLAVINALLKISN